MVLLFLFVFSPSLLPPSDPSPPVCLHISSGEEQGQRQAFPSALRHPLHVRGPRVPEEEAHWEKGKNQWQKLKLPDPISTHSVYVNQLDLLLISF